MKRERRLSEYSERELELLPWLELIRLRKQIGDTILRWRDKGNKAMELEWRLIFNTFQANYLERKERTFFQRPTDEEYRNP